MLFSVVGFYLDTATTGASYNGHSLKPVVDEFGRQVGYQTKIAGTNRVFYSAPQDSQDIALPVGLIDTLHSAQGVVFLFDPTDNQTSVYDQVRFDLAQAIDPRPAGAALTRAASADSPYQYPIANCTSATPEYPILHFTYGNKSISYQDGCFVLAGTAQDIVLERDRILYAYYGITTT
jgi:hypothetical protein